MSQDPKVAIVILNFNTENLLRQFLPSVLDTTYPNKEIYVVDNASSDGSLEVVKSKFPSIITMRFEENYGYAGGYNRSLKEIDADYYVLLNSDVEVEPNWLDPLVRRVQADPKIAAVQPKIKSFKDKHKFEYAGACGGMLDKWAYAFCRGRLFDALEEDHGQYDEATEVFWATGACLFINASVFHEAGSLDETFFAHMEEIDLCWRLKSMGYKNFVEPESVVYHLGGGTLSAGSKRKYYLNYRNNLAMIVKNYNGNYFFLLLWRMVLDGVSAINFLVHGKTEVFVAIIKAHLTFWKEFPTWINRRKEVRALGTAPVTLFPRSVVWAYFGKKINRFSDL